MAQAALYARVSTNNRQNAEMQLRELREYAARRGWAVAAEYVDQGISGSKERRPQLDRLLAECRKRRFDAVVVYRYDRFARSLRQLITALEEFRALGVNFISLHEGGDTSTRKPASCSRCSKGSERGQSWSTIFSRYHSPKVRTRQDAVFPTKKKLDSSA